MTDILIISHNRLQIEKWRRTLSGKYNIKISNHFTSHTPENDSKSYALTIVDSALIDGNFEILEDAKSKFRKILIIGNQWADEKQVLALVAGAAGYCDSTVAFNVLLKAINSILNGDMWIQRHLVLEVIAALSENNKNGQESSVDHYSQEKLQTLSGRELDVVKMIRQGENNKKIATSLHISERTVKAHLTSIFRKVDVPDRLHLAIMFKECNL